MGSRLDRRGIAYALSAYAIWGLFPLYYLWLQHVSAPQLLAHRIVWSCLMLGVVVVLLRQARVLRPGTLTRTTLHVYTIAALLIAVNWLAFVWAVTHDRVIELSLGYFITPLVNVVLGVLFLHERLRASQWMAVGLAAFGVLYLAFNYGAPPWIALTLALSFGTYGLVKKTAPLDSLPGLTLESVLLLPPALVYLLYVESTGDAVFAHADIGSDLLLTGTGILGVISLLFFASATKRVPLSLVGILCYVAPTLQFVVGVLAYAEPLTPARLIAFGCVWTALVVFSVATVRASRIAATSARMGAEAPCAANR